MSALGHERFAVVGHDRGARVAYRLALDHPERVTRVAVLNTVPTVEQFERMGAGPSLGFWPWFLLAQPAPLPGAAAGGRPGRRARPRVRHLDRRSRRHRRPRRARPTGGRSIAPTIAAMCADYRASFHVDRMHDAEDREAGRRIVAPLLLVTGAEEAQLADAPAVWRAWAHDVTAAGVPGGHFVPEEAPEALLAALAPFLG